ncbi:MAG TPA: hypothetical protein VGD43_00700, partial [Micromonospora sp.]
MSRKGKPDEVAALGLLLDRTYEEVAAAARQPRLLDRERLIGWFDLWDNHLMPAVAAAARPYTGRRSARSVWRSIGWWGAPTHRESVAAHLDSLGLDPEALLGPERPPLGPYLNHAGKLRPVEQPLSTELAELIAADYDLVGGNVEHAQ